MKGSWLMVLIDNPHGYQHQPSSQIHTPAQLMLKKSLLDIELFDMLEFQFGNKPGFIAKIVTKKHHNSVNIKFPVVFCITIKWLIIMNFSISTYNQLTVVRQQIICSIGIYIGLFTSFLCKPRHSQQQHHK